MASVHLIPTEQSPITCQLCEVDTRIQWKCCDCDLLMCTKCKDKIHPKFRKAKDHKIVDIKEVGQIEDDSSDDLNYGDIRCQEHPKQTCCLFCKPCDQLVCPNCIAKSHNGHLFLDIKEGYNKKLGKLKEDQGKVDKNVATVLEMEDILNRIKKDETSKYEKAKQDIINTKVALEQEVAKIAEKLTKELDKKWVTVKGSIENGQVQIDKMKKKFGEQYDHVENILSCKDLEKFFKEVDDVDTTISPNIGPINLEVSSMPKFLPAKTTNFSFGTLETALKKSSVNWKPEMEFKIVKKFATPLTHIHFTAACSDGIFWIGDNLTAVLKKVVVEEDRMREISSVDIKVYSIAVTQTEDLLLTTTNDPVVKIINGKSGKLQNSVYNVSPLFATAVFVTNDNKVIVGGHIKDVSIHDEVIIFNDKGEKLTVFKSDQYKKPLFSYPLSITTNKKHLFAVDERAEDFQGRVLTVGQDGNVINIYTGHPEVNKKIAFKPREIVSTKSQCVVVADMDASSLHVLSSDGILLSCFSTKDVGIQFPYSISVASFGNIYIGCVSQKGSSKDVRADLYQVEF